MWFIDFIAILIVVAGVTSLFTIAITTKQDEEEKKKLNKKIRELTQAVVKFDEENTKTKEDMSFLIKDYEELVSLNEKALNLACERLSKEVYIDYLNRYRTAEEWKTEAYKQVGGR